MAGMIALVIPSNRPEFLERWRREWKTELERPDVTLFVVRDDPDMWDEIDETLGADAWIIPRQTDCIRSYGFWQAYQAGADLILTMDDDCLPDAERPGSWVHAHRHELGKDLWSPWVWTISGLSPRGLPQHIWREGPTVLNHGLWRGAPDLDAETQLKYGSPPPPYRLIEQMMPPGMVFPMSGMNLAFRRALTPAMYFGLMGTVQGEDTGFHRYGDIWAGLFAKRIADHLGWIMHSGMPTVQHTRASDPHVNVVTEATAKAATEWLWRAVGDVRLTASTVTACYHELADRLVLPEAPYWTRLRRAMHVWASLYEEGPV